jgi:hypothetical protein
MSASFSVGDHVAYCSPKRYYFGIVTEYRPAKPWEECESYLDANSVILVACTDGVTRDLPEEYLKRDTAGVVAGVLGTMEATA